jgi:hypothetical protein
VEELEPVWVCCGWLTPFYCASFVQKRKINKFNVRTTQHIAEMATAVDRGHIWPLIKMYLPPHYYQ